MWWAGPEEEWLQDPKTATWTYKLMQKFRENANETVDTGLAAPIKCRLRGPYGVCGCACAAVGWMHVVLLMPVRLAGQVRRSPSALTPSTARWC